MPASYDTQSWVVLTTARTEPSVLMATDLQFPLVGSPPPVAVKS